MTEEQKELQEVLDYLEREHETHSTMDRRGKSTAYIHGVLDGLDMAINAIRNLMK